MDYRGIATAQALRAGIDPGLFHALIQQESRWNPNAVSPVGAFGLTQAMPATAANPGFGIRPLSERDNPAEQIRFGADYLSAMLNRYGGDVPRALAAYNWGAGNADKWSGSMDALPKETRGYIQNITGGAGPVPLSNVPLSFSEATLADDGGASESDDMGLSEVFATLADDASEEQSSRRERQSSELERLAQLAAITQRLSQGGRSRTR